MGILVSGKTVETKRVSKVYFCASMSTTTVLVPSMGYTLMWWRMVIGMGSW
jgi:hypothetical protein